jgi:anti-sigma B factor antagonist
MVTESIQVIASNGAANGHRILTLRGPLTIHTIFDFQSAVRTEQSPVVIVDLSGVPYVDSAGLGAIVGAHVSAQRAI